MEKSFVGHSERPHDRSVRDLALAVAYVRSRKSWRFAKRFLAGHSRRRLGSLRQPVKLVQRCSMAFWGLY